MTRWSSRLNATNDAPMVNRSTGPSATDIEPLDPDVGRERHAAEIETQGAARPEVHRVRGFEKHTTQADVEQSNRHRKGQDR